MREGVVKSWVVILSKLPSLFFGLFLFSVGIVANLYSGLGTSSWNVLDVGISNHTVLTLGQVTQLTGLVALLIGWLLGYPPGFGTIADMYFVGLFIDVIIEYGVLTRPINIFGSFFMLFLGILLMGWGTLFYLRVGLGAGPRDGLMMGLVKTLNRPVWAIRGVIEMTVLFFGYLLGGPFGVGTVIAAATIGFSVQLAFKIGKYDSNTEQMDIYQLCKYLVKGA